MCGQRRERGGVRGPMSRSFAAMISSTRSSPPLTCEKKKSGWGGRVSMSHLGFCARSVVTFSASLRMLLIT